jgi:oligoendopeptidase F
MFFIWCVSYISSKFNFNRVGDYFMFLGDNKLGNMPSWDLNDLYVSIDDEQINLDLADLTTKTANFKSYKGNVKNLDANGLYKAIIEFENIGEIEAKLISYAYLNYAENLSIENNARFYQQMMEVLSNLSTELVFFQIEINKLEQRNLNDMFSNSKNLSYYRQVIEDMRVMKSHQLTEDMEKLMIDKDISAKSAWIRLFDETIDNMTFTYNGKSYNESEMIEMMNGSDKKVRRETSKIFGETLGKNAKIFTHIMNTLVYNKSKNDEWRHFKRPISSMNLGNLIEDEVVESLRKTIKDNYVKTAHRYYKWKAKQFNEDKLHYSDRNAPLPFADDKLYKWEEAEKIVRDAYQEFSPEMADIGGRFFDNKWIDVPTRHGKRGGAFMSPTTSKIHPYILLNYTGRSRDVMTLAHELGHGIHQTLSNKNGFLMSNAPLTLAETASVFGEQLVFRKLLENASGKNRKVVLANKVEDMLNTVIRQIAFLEFETRVHDERKSGVISLDRMNEIWLEVQKESLGEDNFIWDEEYKYYWMYIPHFIHSPFYVYSYAFGDCLVNSLYAIYREKPSGFENKYIKLLSSGSSKRYAKLLEPFGLDPKDPSFWQKGVDVLIALIDELETME